MCTGAEVPLLLAATGASVGGGLIQRGEQQKAQNREQQARNGVLSEYLARQKQLQGENALVQDNLMKRFSPEEQAGAQAKAVEGRNADIDAIVPGAPTAANVSESAPISADAPNIIKSQVAGKMLEAFKKSTDQSKAKAKLASFGDVNTGNQFGVIDAGRNIDVTNNAARGETAILPSQQEFAARAAYKPSSGIGEILQALGGIGAGVAGSGYLRPGAKSPISPGGFGIGTFNSSGAI